MLPGPNEYPRTASPSTPFEPLDESHQHGLPSPHEPHLGPLRFSDAEREGPAEEEYTGFSRPRTNSELSTNTSLNINPDNALPITLVTGQLNKKIRSGRQTSYKTGKVKSVHTEGLFILDLPNEILTHVLSYLPAETLIAAALVCHRFHQLVTTPHAWRDAFLRYFPGAISPDPKSGNVRGSGSSTHGGRSFTRLTALASWRSEYILRTRLLRSLARGKPPVLPQPESHQGAKARQAVGMTIFESQQVDIVDRIHGDFGTGIDGRRPRFRYGTTYVGRLGQSDPANNAPDNWGLREQNLFSRFDRDFFGLAQPFGLGAGEVVGTANPMDVSQPFGAIHAEGLPGGRIYFHHALEKDGRFLTFIRAHAASAEAGVPYVDPAAESICSVWIAKNHNISNVSNGLLGMLSGASSGILTAFSLGTNGLSGPRMQRGEITAKWALCPGVPIIDIKVDDGYSIKRYGCNRVFVTVLNALGEVYYLKEMFTQSREFLPHRPTEDDMNTLAWQSGRSVKWGLVAPTARVPATSDGDKTPRSSWFGAGLTPSQLAIETREIESFVRKRPKYFRDVCYGWDMQRRIEVDFAGDDEVGAGEAVLVFDCGVKDGVSLPLRATRFVRGLDLGHDAEASELLESGSSPLPRRYAQSQDGYEGQTRGDPDPASDQWLQSDFSFGSINDEVATTTIDNSTFATLTVDEDPLLNLSASTTSSPWGSPGGAMPRPSTVAEMPGHRARLVAAGTNQGSIVLWDIRAPVASSRDVTNTISPLQIIRTQSPCITCLGLTGLYLVHGGNDGLVQAWDPLGSVAGPLRTLNSRYSIRSRHRFVMAGTTPERAGYDFFMAGGISLDPDATTLRGMVSLGSLLRYWYFSSDAAEQYKGSKRKWRRNQRASSGRSPNSRDGEAAQVLRRATMDYYIADEVKEMKAEQRADRKEQARLANRFGVGLLGPDATEAEMLAYATMLSNETEERRNFGRAVTPPPAEAASLKGLREAENFPSPNELDVDEAIRRSLQEDTGNYPIRYNREKRPKAGSPQASSPPIAASSSNAPLPISSAAAENADVEFALQLSLAEEQSRTEASASFGEWEDVRELDEGASTPTAKSKGKGKAH